MGEAKVKTATLRGLVVTFFGDVEEARAEASKLDTLWRSSHTVLHEEPYGYYIRQEGKAVDYDRTGRLPYTVGYLLGKSGARP